ncbi:shikimate kinase [Candidatus Woesearchaeota archaeon]|nr:shikimate kinase [Candidatus Woesearchaeota archaeon]
MNIALIGFRGAGKTTIAKLLSRKLGKKLISTDGEIEKRTRMSIAKFVKKYGWDKFREVESDVIEYISDFDDCVFDTGGGIVMRNENVINLKKNGLVVLLTADIKTTTNRLKAGKGRPALTKKGNFLEEIKDVLKEREERYKRAADYTIDTSRLKPEEACDLIMHYVQMEMQ